MPNLKVKIGKLELKNPVMSASGTFGSAREFADFFDINQLGAIICKTITKNPRTGNPPPRTAEVYGGMLNAIGLENKGLQKFIEEEIPFLSTLKTNIIVSIAADNTQDFCTIATEIEKTKVPSALEINMSCPNLGNKSGKMCAQDGKSVEQVIKALKKEIKIPIIAKLSPNVTDITDIAKSAEKAGADAISLINAFPAMAVDIKTRKPMLGNITGGLSGPAIKHIALKMVWDCYNTVKIPIVAIGGIMTWQDAIEFIICGASALQIGTANFVNPTSCIDIINGMENYLQTNNLGNINDLKSDHKFD
jgi:dihydroorotate dehydrogenase (NAD+) catalytic subunit